MPRYDGTGPAGGGPMTGGGRGYCSYPGEGYGRPLGYGRGMAYRRGFGGGYGPGRGLRRRVWRGYEAYPPPAAREFGREEELDMLRREADAIRNSLEYITGRIAELEKGE